MGLEHRKTKKRGVRAKENQEKRGHRGGKSRKAMLQQRKTKKSEVSTEENQEKWG